MDKPHRQGRHVQRYGTSKKFQKFSKIHFKGFRDTIPSSVHNDEQRRARYRLIRNLEMLTSPHAGDVDDKANTGELGTNRQSRPGPPLEHGQQPNAPQPCHPSAS
ncbi:hypothetical protein V6N13_060714 [Hibiscus sabdariffa]|uniref:Uncharacterized protein n=1 Tax=Hibiscus sabdariffa TaxID=183260 RepID=A0ABR2P6X0_9ROSI